MCPIALALEARGAKLLAGYKPTLSQDGAYGRSSLGAVKRVPDPREGVPCRGGPVMAAACVCVFSGNLDVILSLFCSMPFSHTLTSSRSSERKKYQRNNTYTLYGAINNWQVLRL